MLVHAEQAHHLEQSDEGNRGTLRSKMSTMVIRFVSCTIVTKVHFPLGCITRENVVFEDEKTSDEDTVQVDVREDVERNWM